MITWEVKFYSNVNRFIEKIANPGDTGTALVRETLTALPEELSENRLSDIKEKLAGTTRRICPAERALHVKGTPGDISEHCRCKR